MRVTGTRTFLELRVGSHHTAEIILYLRRADMEWFNSDSKTHFQELLDLLTNSIVPRMCYEEIERFYSQKYPQRFPPDSKKKIADKNAVAGANKKKKDNNNNSNPKRGKKRKLCGKKQDEEESMEPKQKDIYYAFGDTLHIAYKTETVDVYDAVTLVFANPKSTNKNNDKKKKTTNEEINTPGNGGFKQLKKLSKRFLLWCYITDSNDDPENDPDPEKDPPENPLIRPEMIPISSLFRGQAEEDD